MESSLDIPAKISHWTLLTAIPGIGLTIWTLGVLSLKCYLAITVGVCCLGVIRLLAFTRFSPPAKQILHFLLLSAQITLISVVNKQVSWNFALQLILFFAISAAAIDLLLKKKFSHLSPRAMTA